MEDKREKYCAAILRNFSLGLSSSAEDEGEGRVSASIAEPAEWRRWERSCARGMRLIDWLGGRTMEERKWAPCQSH